MVIRGMNGLVANVPSDAVFFLEAKGRKDSVTIVLTVLANGEDGEEVAITMSDAMTRQEGETVEDAFFTALSNGDEIIDLRSMPDTV